MQLSTEFASDWAFLLVLDTAVFILTVRKALPIVREDPYGRSSLPGALLRDGEQLDLPDTLCVYSYVLGSIYFA